MYRYPGLPGTVVPCRVHVLVIMMCTYARVQVPHVPVAVRLSGLLCVFLAYRNTVYGTRVVVQSKLRSMKIQSLHTRRYIHTYIHVMYDVVGCYVQNYRYRFIRIATGFYSL